MIIQDDSYPDVVNKSAAMKTLYCKASSSNEDIQTALLCKRCSRKWCAKAHQPFVDTINDTDCGRSSLLTAEREREDLAGPLLFNRKFFVFHRQSPLPLRPRRSKYFDTHSSDETTFPAGGQIDGSFV